MREEPGAWSDGMGAGGHEAADAELDDGGGGFLRLLAGGKKHANHANRGRDGLRSEREVFVGMVDGGEVDAQKDKPAGDEWSFHKSESFSE